MAYFPNSTAGDVLEQQCDKCPAGKDGRCPIVRLHLRFNYDQLDKGQEKLREALTVLVAEDGKCNMMPLIAPKEESTDPLAWLDK